MYLRLTRIASWLVLVLSFCFLLSVGVAVDPDTLNRAGIALVFGVIFLLCGSTIYLLLTSLALRFLGEVRTASYQGSALRQGGLLALFVTLVLAAQYWRVLTWWAACLGFVFILLIELTCRRILSFRR